jgi:hypothetical protein
MLFRSPIVPVHESNDVSNRIVEQLKLRGFKHKVELGKLSYVRGSHFASQVSILPRKWYANARLLVQNDWLVFELDVDMANRRIDREVADFWNAEVQGILNRASGREATQVAQFEEAILAQVQKSQRAEFRDVVRLIRVPVAVATVVLVVGLLLPRVLREAFLVLGLGVVAKIWIPAVFHSWYVDRIYSQVPPSLASKDGTTRSKASQEKT